MVIYLLQSAGKITIKLLQNLGHITLFLIAIMVKIFTGHIPFKETCKQIINLGINSIPLISLTAIFTGAVLALQSYIGFARFNAEQSIPVIIIASLTRELGPVLTALMCAGRIGAGITAELSTMKVSEQIDALKLLSVDVIEFLIIPRFIAVILSVFMLTIMADIVGVFGGYIVSTYKLNFDSNSYLMVTAEHLIYEDIISGLVKSIIFGIIIALSSSLNGIYCGTDTKSVGYHTTKSVVTSCIFILIFNYLVTSLFFM